MQLVTWFLTCLLFAQPVPSQHAVRGVAAPATTAAVASPAPVGPNDTPPILPLPTP